MTTKLLSGASLDKFLEKRSGGPLTFGKALRAVRTTIGLTQVEFAKKLGISKANLCDIEKDRRFVSADKAAEFSRRVGHPETVFIKLAIDDQLRRFGLKYKVELRAA